MRHFSSSEMILSIVVMFLLLEQTHCSLKQMKLFEFQEKLQQKTTFGFANIAATPTPAPANSHKQSNGRVFYPIEYGADPTGAQDSAAAILAALNDATKSENGVELLPGINDLGGVEMDLQGGTFKISTPIKFPPAIGNILVKGGTVRASSSFPGDRHLFELWAPNSVKPASSSQIVPELDLNNGMQYEDITFRDVLFDSNYQGGSLLIIDSARIRIIDCFFLRFATEGILIVRGHETFISGCFLGQHPTVGGDRAEISYSGTAIDIASTDNVVTDVVIFSAGTGIILRGRANIVTGVHCYNKATYFGGIGILVKSAQNRIVNPYLDYNSIVIEDPDQIHVSNGFFLGNGNIVLKSVQGRISGLNIVNNIFSGDPKNMVPLVKLDGQFKNIDQVVIDQNVVDGMSLISTVGKLTVAGNGTKWVADFNHVLLFPNRIGHVQYSFYARGGVNADGLGFPEHALRNVSDNVVMIESKWAANAVVSVFVDQNNLSGGGSYTM